MKQLIPAVLGGPGCCPIWPHQSSPDLVRMGLGWWDPSGTTLKPSTAKALRKGTINYIPRLPTHATHIHTYPTQGNVLPQPLVSPALAPAHGDGIPSPHPCPLHNTSGLQVGMGRKADTQLPLTL